MKYVRVQVYYSGKLGYPVGIFGACHHLRRAKRLSPEDDKLFGDVDSWFDRQLPIPPFYEDGNSLRAITWFKETSIELLAALTPLEDLLRRHAVDHHTVCTEDPGDIVYEDQYQVGVINPRFPSE